MSNLTQRQKEIYEYLQEYFIDNHHIPTRELIAERFGFRSANAAQEHMSALEKKGYLEKTSERRWRFSKLEAGLL